MTGQDKGFREKVDEIILAVYSREIYMHTATDRIVQLVRELVPDAYPDKYDFNDEDQSNRNWGWNSCRTEIISKLEASNVS